VVGGGGERADVENSAGVAIVDDEIDLVRTYELLFRRMRIPMAFAANDGEEAIEKFRMSDPKPSIVIIDHRLPSMSGLDVMKAILALEPRTKIVFISGDDSVRQASLDAGAAAFMEKPTPIRVIIETINSLIGA
jgi:two-component system chemotaxis response regulator CheY